MVATKRAILLVNTYCLLLEPIYDKKWEFLHERVLLLLLEKSSEVLNSSQLSIWDYLCLYDFFDQLARGKLRSKQYDHFTEDYKSQMEGPLSQIRHFSKLCWDKFESLMTEQFFWKFLITVSKHLWDNGKVYASKEKNPSKVSPMVPLMLREFKEFFIDFVYRLNPPQIDYLVKTFYEYFLYVCEYILYVVYHKDGSNEGVFMLPQKDKALFDKAKLFKMKNIPEIQEQKVFKVGYISLFGMETLMTDIYAFSTGINWLYKLSKPVSPESFLVKLAKIHGKDKN